MQNRTRQFIVDICGWVACLTIIFFFFTFWLYSYNSINAPLKEAWSLSVTCFSALASLGAAIIAAELVSQWKQQSQYYEINKYLSSLPNLMRKITREAYTLREDPNVFSYLKQFFDPQAPCIHTFQPPNFENIEAGLDDLLSVVNEIESLCNYKNVVFSETMDLDTFHDLSSKVSSLKAKYNFIKYSFPEDRTVPLNERQIQAAVDCSNGIRAQYAYNYPAISNTDLYEMFQNINMIRADIKKFRGWLETYPH